MQGSFDDPPIVVASDADKTWLWLLAAVAGLALGAWEMRYGHLASHTARGVWLIVLSLLAVAAFVYRLVSPNVLTVGSEGIALKRLWRTQRYGWAQLGPFYLRPLSVVPSVQADLAQPSARMRHVVIGNGWEGSAQQMCDLLNAARARWGGQ